MATYILEVCESVGVRYEAHVILTTEASSREEAIDNWEEKERQLGGQEDGRREFAHTSNGYRSKLEAAYALTEQQSLNLEELPISLTQI